MSSVEKFDEELELKMLMNAKSHNALEKLLKVVAVHFSFTMQIIKDRCNYFFIFFRREHGFLSKFSLIIIVFLL
jgi:hypothetical protein